jgi:type II secretory pathway pseudopilin PulG
MIKFFRKIRQNMIKENKVSKYMLYAIGEIVLVVIGILIALSINNWNQSQKEKRIETQYLNNIVRDLNEQLSSIEVQMEYEQSYYEAASYLIEDYNKDHVFTLDSIFYKRATVLIYRKTFVITDPTYTDLISSGNINIIKNQTYKNHLLNYYQELERIEKIIQNNNSLIIDHHYIATFLKNGYSYENLFEVYGKSLAKFPGHVVVPNYETDIQEISKNVILKDENKLALMNAITLRQTIALGHYELLLSAKSDTKSLIKGLENKKHD